MILLIFIILFLVSLILSNKEHYKKIHNINIKTVFRTPTERKTGLMFMKKIDKNTGFLFYYDTPEYARFWMKNTYVPLDIILIDEKYKVIGLFKNMVPHSLKIRHINKKIKYAIEIKKGYINQQNIYINDFINFIYQ